jgi:hypothetical protein
MDRVMHPGTVAIFAVCLANLGLLASTALFRTEQHTEVLETVSSKGPTRFPLAVVLAFSSQLLYLALGVAWWFRWMKFYPGNPVQTFAMCAGILLALGALVMAGTATGVRLFAATFVGVVTLGLWLLSALASSVV